MKSLRIATRKSPLALWQANYVKEKLLISNPKLNIEIVGMTTQGDQQLDQSLAEVGGKGLFLKELERSLLTNETDIAVHSMKDVPAHLPDGLSIAAICKREDARDAFVSNRYQNLYALPEEATVGTSSLRRISQLKNAFPNLRFINLRGNIHSRIKKLDNGDFDAIILATAGLKRMNLSNRIRQHISPETCLPAAGQGAIGIECRADDTEIKKILNALNHHETAVCLAAERKINEILDGGCQAPIAGFTHIKNGKLHMRAIVGKVDGSDCLKNELTSRDISIKGAEKLGTTVADYLITLGAKQLLSEAKKSPSSISDTTKPSILVTRQNDHLGNTEAILKKLDYTPVHIPAIQIQPNLSESIKSQLTDAGQNYTDIIFVSRNAVQIALPIITQEKQLPPSVRVITVGAETAKILYKHGVKALFPSSKNGMEALLKVKKLNNLSGRKILIVRGKHGLDWPAEELKRRGADTVDSVFCYAQQAPHNIQSQIEQLFSSNNDIRAILLHSNHSVENIMPNLIKYRTELNRCRLIVGSRNISKTARNYGWTKPIVIAKSPSNKDMLVALASS